MSAPALAEHSHTLVPLGESTATARFIAGGASPSGSRQRRAMVAAFTRTFTDLDGWDTAPLSSRLVTPVAVRGLVAFLLVTTSRRTDADYVRRCRSDWGHHAAAVYPTFAETFHSTATALGFTTVEARRQWCILAKIAVTAGTPPKALSTSLFGEAADELTAAHTRPNDTIPVTWSTALHGLKATLTALGILAGTPPTRLSPSSRDLHWRALAARAPHLVATLRRYLTQIQVSMRPGSVALIDTTLRHFAVYLTDHHGYLTHVAEIRRTHIEGFKTFLTARPGYRGSRGPAKTTTGMRLGHLRGFFDRIIEWDYADVPPRNPVFAADIPIRDRLLPRFLGDADAAALLTAARALPDLFDRVTVEILARTGLRKGEYLGLTRDAITQVGDGRWLRTPVGKLHTDRYIPLHPRVDELLQQ